MSQENIKPFNGKNFQVWEFRVTTAVEKLALENYFKYPENNEKVRKVHIKNCEKKKKFCYICEIFSHTIHECRCNIKK